MRNGKMTDILLLLLFILVVVVALLCCLGVSVSASKIVQGGADCDDEVVDGGCMWGGGFGMGSARLGIREPWYKAMVDGKKTVEGRLKRGAAASLKVGDAITIARSRAPEDSTEHPGARRYDTKVVRVTPYRSFAELVKKEGPSTLFPGKTSEKEVVEIYRQHSSEADEAEIVKSGTDGHAVVAIEVAKPSAEERKKLENFKPAPRAAAAHKSAAHEAYAW